MTSAPRLIARRLALLTCVLLAATGCGGESDAGRASPTSAGSAATSAEEPTTTTTPGRSWIVALRPDVSTVEPLDAPGGAPLRLDTAGDGTRRTVTVSNPLPSGAPTTFLMASQATAADGATWYEVLLPVRPNGSTGWVPEAQVSVSHTDLAATVDRAAHTLTLRDADEVVATYPVAIGTDATPTPTGRYYVKELVEPGDPNGTYGPIAYGLSAFSPTLVDTEAFADGVIGIHGTNQPDLIGTSVSHGCVRMRNADILDLESRQVPLGMPVDVV